MDTFSQSGIMIGRILKDLDTLAEIGHVPGHGINRIAFSKEEVHARKVVMEWMMAAGLDIRIDTAGNIIGRRNGLKELPPVATGSHLDSVPSGGKFDGVLGILSAIEAIRVMNEYGIKTHHPIEMIVFAPEEPNPFGISCVGSKAMAGKIPANLPFERLNDKGESLAEAWKRIGAHPEKLIEAKVPQGRYHCFLELHIEQGPHLHQRGIPVGIVSVITGLTRWRIEISGRSDHAGTTSMRDRKDALAGASDFILSVEKICKKLSTRKIVGTIGCIKIVPNQVNIVPGKAIMELDLRGIEIESIELAKTKIKEVLQNLCSKRGLGLELKGLSAEPPFVLSSDIQNIIKKVCRENKISYLELPSGAGHDANHMATITKTGMIFVPSVNGISHNPDEFTESKDVETGTFVLLKTLLKLAKEVEIK